MFPLTHLYVNKLVWGTLDADRALGSVLPDLLTSNRIAWGEAHAIKRPVLLPKAVFLSDALHGTGLPGLDFYTDQSYADGPGYAFGKAKALQSSLHRLGLPWQDTLWRGHNIVEMAVETMVGENHRALYTPLWCGLNQRTTLDRVQDSLSRAVNRPLDLFGPLSLFLSLDARPEVMSRHYADKLNDHYATRIESRDIDALIVQAMTLVSADYQSFLAECIRRMRRSLHQLERSLT